MCFLCLLSSKPYVCISMKGKTMKNYLRILISLVLICVFGLACVSNTPSDAQDGSFKVARLKSHRKSGTRNAGIVGIHSETLDAGQSVAIAEIEGPAVITHIHMTKHFYFMFGGPKHTSTHERGIQGEDKRSLAVEGDVFASRALLIKEMPEEERRALAARGIILEVYYNGNPTPAIRVPVGDFFADGCGGRAKDYSTPFVEIAPESYNCFIPMPFEKSARIVLKNETPYHFVTYLSVEFEKLSEWKGDLGYLHATWKRFAFQLDGETIEPFFRVNGQGQLLGSSWSICTDEPNFSGFAWVMEGDNEIRIDGEEKPSILYTGTECAFSFCFGFLREFIGLYDGMNFVRNKTPSMVSTYRFRSNDVIRFNKSLDWRINWAVEAAQYVNLFDSHDEAFEHIMEAGMKQLEDLRKQGRGWVDYAITTYWYQDKVGYDHDEMLPLEERVKPILHPNPVE